MFLKGAIIACSLFFRVAAGFENRPYTIPVAKAKPKSPIIDSVAATTLAKIPIGATLRSRHAAHRGRLLITLPQ